jgi:hypothetical protein
MNLISVSDDFSTFGTIALMVEKPTALGGMRAIQVSRKSEG